MPTQLGDALVGGAQVDGGRITEGARFGEKL